MIDTSTAYREAVTGTTRRTRLRIVVDISDPDLTYTGVSATDQSAVSVPEQLHDKEFELARFSTLELNRWLLDGTFAIFDDQYEAGGAQIGGVSESKSGADGSLSPALFFEQQFTNSAILQVCAVWFSADEVDGRPVDFTVSVMQNGSAIYSKAFTDNTEDHVTLTGFTVYNPDAIRITITKWSTPHRRVRIEEIIPGAYERWDDNKVTDLTVNMTADPSCVSLPYGTCALVIDNTGKTFEPRNKDGIFQSLQERQGIEVLIGVLVNGAYDYKGAGMFYQYNGGWKTSNNGMTLRWDLVDILGLLAGREFVPPSTLPTTVTGWVEAVLSMLGSNFTGRHTIDESVAEQALTVQSVASVTGLKCGDMVRYICMATGTWPRAEAETGNLAIEPLWSQGNRISLDNMETYPIIQANEDVAQIIFTLADGNNTQYAVAGNSAASSKSVSVNNPFIKTAATASAAARNMVTQFGGNVFQITGRGDPSTEIGDVATLELDERGATSARVISQSFNFSRQVLSGCATKAVQPAGIFQYSNREQLTEDGTWTVPSGVSVINVVLVGGGTGGHNGNRGGYEQAGSRGADGAGGKIWHNVLIVSPGDSFAVTIGAGGAVGGGAGGDTMFGNYSSGDGRVYTPSYTDVSSGAAFGRTGSFDPLPNTGDGGAGGEGGAKGESHQVKRKDLNGFVHYRTVVDQRPGDGLPGYAGAAGCVVIYYDTPGA